MPVCCPGTQAPFGDVEGRRPEAPASAQLPEPPQSLPGLDWEGARVSARPQSRWQGSQGTARRHQEGRLMALTQQHVLSAKAWLLCGSCPFRARGISGAQWPLSQLCSTWLAFSVPRRGFQVLSILPGWACTVILFVCVLVVSIPGHNRFWGVTGCLPSSILDAHTQALTVSHPVHADTGRVFGRWFDPCVVTVSVTVDAAPPSMPGLPRLPARPSHCCHGHRVSEPVVT